MLGEKNYFQSKIKLFIDSWSANLIEISWQPLEDRKLTKSTLKERSEAQPLCQWQSFVFIFSFSFFCPAAAGLLQIVAMLFSNYLLSLVIIFVFWCFRFMFSSVVSALSDAARCPVRVPSHFGQQASVPLLLLHGWQKANSYSCYLHCPAHLEHSALHTVAGRLSSQTEPSVGHSTREYSWRFF